MKGPGGYGRYDDDPGTVGCPFAKSDMSPCLARDGALCLSDGARRVCVGCGHEPGYLITDLAKDYPPAREYVISANDPGKNANAFRDLVRRATDPLAAATLATMTDKQREQLYAALRDAEQAAAGLRQAAVMASSHPEPRPLTQAREEIDGIRAALDRAESVINRTTIPAETQEA